MTATPKACPASAAAHLVRVGHRGLRRHGCRRSRATSQPSQPLPTVDASSRCATRRPGAETAPGPPGRRTFRRAGTRTGPVPPIGSRRSGRASLSTRPTIHRPPTVRRRAPPPLLIGRLDVVHRLTRPPLRRDHVGPLTDPRHRPRRAEPVAAPAGTVRADRPDRPGRARLLRPGRPGFARQTSRVANRRTGSDHACGSRQGKVWAPGTST